MSDEIRAIPAVFELDYIQVVSGTKISPTTTVGIKTENGVVEKASTGDGPVDAAFKAIGQVVDIQLNLIDYQIRSVTEGEDAIGEVSLKVQDNGTYYHRTRCQYRHHRSKCPSLHPCY